MNPQLRQALDAFVQCDRQTTSGLIRQGQILAELQDNTYWRHDFASFMDVLAYLGLKQSTGYQYIQVYTFARDHQALLPATLSYRILRRLPRLKRINPLAWTELTGPGLVHEGQRITLAQLDEALLTTLLQPARVEQTPARQIRQKVNQIKQAINDLEALGFTRTQLIQELLGSELPDTPVPAPTIELPEISTMVESADEPVDDSLTIITPKGIIHQAKTRATLLAQLQAIGFGYEGDMREAEKLIDTYGTERVAQVTAWTIAEYQNGVTINGKPIGNPNSLIRFRLNRKHMPTRQFLEWSKGPTEDSIDDKDLEVLALAAKQILALGRDQPSLRQLRALELYERQQQLSKAM